MFIYAITVAGILANTTLTPALPDVLDTFGRPDSSAGIVVAAGPTPGVLIAPLVGILADRLGRKRVLIPCLIVFSIGSLAVAAAPTFELLIAARLAQGFGSAGLINLAVVLIGDHWTGEERTRLVGKNAAVLTTCLAVVPSVSGGITELTSWRYAVGLGSIGLFVALAGIRLLHDARPTPSRSVRDQIHQAATIVRQPVIASTLLIGFLLFVVIFGVFLTAFPLLLEDEFGLGAGARGLVLSVPALGAVLVSSNLTRVRRRFALRTVLVGGCLAIAVAALIIGVAPIIPIVLVGGTLYGFGEGSTIPSLQDIAITATPDEHRASVMASWVAAARLGQAMGPLAAAGLLSVTTQSTTITIGAGLFAVAAVIAAFGPIDDEAVANSAR